MSHPDRRYRVETPSHRHWNLIINSVNTSDQGEYACQVNTNPVKQKLVMLYVKGRLTCHLLLSRVTFGVSRVIVPPRIVFMSGDETADEGDDVSLRCQAQGEPQPRINWFRIATDSTGNQHRTR